MLTRNQYVTLRILVDRAGKEPAMHKNGLIPRGAVTEDTLSAPPSDLSHLNVNGYTEGWFGGWWRITDDGRRALATYEVVNGLMGA